MSSGHSEKTVRLCQEKGKKDHELHQPQYSEGDVSQISRSRVPQQNPKIIQRAVYLYMVISALHYHINLQNTWILSWKEAG